MPLLCTECLACRGLRIYHDVLRHATRSSHAADAGGREAFCCIFRKWDTAHTLHADQGTCALNMCLAVLQQSIWHMKIV